MLLIKALWMMMTLVSSFITLCFNSSTAAVFMRLHTVSNGYVWPNLRDVLYATHSGSVTVHNGMDILAFPHVIVICAHLYMNTVFTFKIRPKA